MVTKLSAASNECAIESVTIYKDRAEVIRKIRFLYPETGGEHKLEIHSITDKANPDSFRVRGTALCDVIEVSHSREFNSRSKVDETNASESRKERVKELETKLFSIEKGKKTANLALQRIKDQRKYLATYVNHSLSNQKEIQIQNAKSVLEYQSELSERLDTQELALSEELENFNNEIVAIKSELSNLTEIKHLGVNQPSRTLYLVLNIKPATPSTPKEDFIQLSVSYIVYDSSWTASYDIRVNTSSTAVDAATMVHSDGGSDLMHLQYYAEVVQKSGEDWNDCCLFLSTSNPAEGSAPPTLPNLIVNFERPAAYDSSNYKKKSSRGWRSNDDCCDDDEDVRERGGSLCLMPDEVYGNFQSANLSKLHSSSTPPQTAPSAGLAGTGDAGSTLFVVNHHVSIPADSKPHKVLVTSTKFIPQLVHYLAPSVSTTAYLQAKARNISPFPLLSSSQVSIFLDGNFVCTSQLKQTNPGETFTIYLGADPAFKAEYLPCRSAVSSKWLSSTQTKTFSYTTILHNTRRSALRVIVAEVLPRSSSTTDIKVELLEPSKTALSKPLEGANLVTNTQDIFQTIDVLSTASAAATATPTTTAASSKTKEPDSKDKAPSAKRSSDAGGDSGWPKDFVSLNETTNSVVWLKTVAPNSKVEIKFDYSVSYPQGKSISVISV